MFADFDESSFPIVNVILHEGPLNDNDFNLFIQKWVEYYNNKQFFSFVFDTTELKNPSFKYALKMPIFIYYLKKRNIQYLEKSIILINDNKIKYLLDFIFSVQKPVAPVYIYNIKQGMINDHQDIIKDENTLTIMP
jgi:hypothetical protein